MNAVALSGISRRAGGLFYAVSSLCKGLESGGVHMSVLGAGKHYTDEDKAVWNPVRVTPYQAFGPLGSSFELRRLLASSTCDLLHLHGIWQEDQYLALRWQKKNDRPVVISPHGMLDSWAVQNEAWKKKLVGMLFANESLRKATCFHALCQSEAESIRAYGLKSPIAIIPNGVELPKIGGQRVEDRSQSLAGNGKKRLLFLGRIHPKKGLSELLHAWSMECGVWSREWKLLIAGWDDGGYEGGLKALSKELGVDDSVEFIGSKFGAEKETLLRNVDAFILPSFSEGLPMSVLEAWAYQLPVVMTEHCNLPEGFEADAAIRVEPNAHSIGHGLKILTALSDIELQNLGARGRMLVEVKFTWSRISQQMASVYKWCVKGGIAPACIEYWNEP